MFLFLLRSFFTFLLFLLLLLLLVFWKLLSFLILIWVYIFFVLTMAIQKLYSSFFLSHKPRLNGILILIHVHRHTHEETVKENNINHLFFYEMSFHLHTRVVTLVSSMYECKLIHTYIYVINICIIIIVFMVNTLLWYKRKLTEKYIWVCTYKLSFCSSNRKKTLVFFS